MLIPVNEYNEEHQKFLYSILQERYRSSAINIPGRTIKECPSYNEHIKYLLTIPYRLFYIYILDDVLAGTIYLAADNRVGIFFLECFCGRGLGKTLFIEFLEQHPDIHYMYCHINPTNHRSLVFFSKMGFQKEEDCYVWNR